MAVLRSSYSVYLALVALTLLSNLAIAQTDALRLDANSTDNTGRNHLTLHLDTIAEGYIAKRTSGVASIHTRTEAEVRQAYVRKQLLSLIGSLPEPRHSIARLWASLGPEASVSRRFAPPTISSAAPTSITT
jgi:hypothetical protein